MKKLLIIGRVWVEPNSSAAGVRMLSFINLFQQQGWNISFACAAVLSPHRFDLQQLDIKETQIELNNASFDDFIIKLNPDMVFFDRFISEEQFGWRVQKHLPQALRVLDTEDLHSLRHCREQLIKQEKELTPKLTDPAYLYQLMQQTEITKREIAALYRSDMSLFISEFEMTLLKTQFNIPASLLHYCPFLLNAPESKQLEFEQKNHFIWIGNFRHPPNWDAVLWLKQQIWPLIHQQLPQAELHIYGAYPPKKATALHNPKQKFYIKGWIEDADKTMMDARICLAPLRFGAGLKGKLTQAMLNGTPSITTPIGAEGINQQLPWAGEITLNAPQFAHHAVNLYKNKEKWQQAQQQGFNILKTNFDYQKNADDLIQQLEQKFNNLISERQQNFIGSILHHHQYNSTKYMALWIEAKNA